MFNKFSRDPLWNTVLGLLMLHEGFWLVSNSESVFYISHTFQWYQAMTRELLQKETKVLWSPSVGGHQFRFLHPSFISSGTIETPQLFSPQDAFCFFRAVFNTLYVQAFIFLISLFLSVWCHKSSETSWMTAELCLWLGREQNGWDLHFLVTTVQMPTPCGLEPSILSRGRKCHPSLSHDGVGVHMGRKLTLRLHWWYLLRWLWSHGNESQ